MDSMNRAGEPVPTATDIREGVRGVSSREATSTFISRGNSAMRSPKWAKWVLAPLALGIATCFLWGADEPPDPKKLAEPNRVEPADERKEPPAVLPPVVFQPPEGNVVLEPPDEE